MNDAAVKLAIFTRDLLNKPEESVVVIGRENMTRGDFSPLKIVIDNVDSSTAISTSRKYDGVLEELQHVQKISSPATIDFYGDGAYSECNKFKLLLSSQKSYELQRDERIEVYIETAIIDLKILTGEQYSERFQIGLQIQFNIELVEPILRIDTLQNTVITN